MYTERSLPKVELIAGRGQYIIIEKIKSPDYIDGPLKRGSDVAVISQVLQEGGGQSNYLSPGGSVRPQ